jgi:hypothetical protein
LYTGGGTNHKGVFFPSPITIGKISGVVGNFSGGEYSEYTMCLYKVPYDTDEKHMALPQNLQYYKQNYLITSITSNLKQLVEKGNFGQPNGTTPYLLYKAEEGLFKFVITLEHKTNSADNFYRNGLITPPRHVDGNHVMDIQYQDIKNSKNGFFSFFGQGVNRWNLASSVNNWSNSYSTWYHGIADSFPNGFIGELYGAGFGIVFAPLGVLTSFISDLFSGDFFKSKQRVEGIHLMGRHPDLQVFRSIKVRYIKYVDVHDGIEALFKNSK